MQNEINENYRKQLCVDKMSEDHKKAFYEFVNYYAPKFPDREILNNSVFTPHNFNQHCFDIYKIISNIILDKNIVYDTAYKLTSKELLLLNLAVLFHDISMSDSLTARRENHSVDSAKYVEKEFAERTFSGWKALSLNEVSALQEIIKAHSDVKDGTVNELENGLNAPALTYKYVDNDDDSDLRVLLLAAILRVADEMDVTSARLGTRKLEKDLENALKSLKEAEEGSKFASEDLKRAKDYAVSLEHWKRLYYFSSIIVDKEDPKKVILWVDHNYYKRAIKDGAVEEGILDEIVGVYSAISERLREAVDIVFSMYAGISIRTITLNSDDDSITQKIKNRLSRVSFEMDEGETKEDEKKNPDGLIDVAIDEKLSKEVEKRELLSFGHFKLSSTYCARDWINTKELVETRRINEAIVKIMGTHIKDNFKEECTIVGVGLVGTIIASRIAFYLGRPLTYIIPEKERASSGEFEKKTKIDENEKIILVTDVIVTYETLSKEIDGKHSENVLAIYTIFLRRNNEIPPNDWLDKTYYLNDKFDVELFKKTKCKYVKNCIAKNQTVNSINIQE